MNNLKSIESNQLVHEFKICTQLQYNGQLIVKNSQGKKWTFYYRLGQMIWATGGTHPSRRLRRNITKFCTQINIDKLYFSSENVLLNCWDYYLLQNLYQNQKIQLKQVDLIIESTISELLFDLAQTVNSTSLSYERNQEVLLKVLMTSTSTNRFLQQMVECWDHWSQAGLADLSPHLAPIIIKPEILQQKVSPTAYKNFENLFNGKHTLWDLSIKVNHNILSVSRSLLPYIEQGIAKLVEVPDLPLVIKNNYSITPIINHRNTPIIACVDDSPQICAILEKIITSNGMRFIKIENPLEALPILIQQQPDLIFLDLIMPSMNGYELCANLRRTSVFANTPIAILTGSDGTFDRFRSKVFGATDFINKPVNRDQVMQIVDKYLEPKKATANLSNLSYSY